LPDSFRLVAYSEAIGLDQEPATPSRVERPGLKAPYYDDATGKELWKIRLNDVPSSSPITYTASGKQYMAVVVGNGGPQAVGFTLLVPEIQNPPDRNAAIWVFELPAR
jgi:hypothetical protein